MKKKYEVIREHCKKDSTKKPMQKFVDWEKAIGRSVALF